MRQARGTETSAERIEDGLREQIDRIAGWLGENAELQGKATPEALPELEREQRMLERALKATTERRRSPFPATPERSCVRLASQPRGRRD